MSVFDRKCRSCPTLVSRDDLWLYKHSICRFCERLGRRAASHGLPVEALRAAWERQGGRCAICRVDLDRSLPRDVHVDHCHETELFRGFLCRACNHGLGLFGDDAMRLNRAAEYLLQQEGEERPEIYRTKRTRTPVEEFRYLWKELEEIEAENRSVHEALVRILGPNYKDWAD